MQTKQFQYYLVRFNRKRDETVLFCCQDSLTKVYHHLGKNALAYSDALYGFVQTAGFFLLTLMFGAANNLTPNGGEYCYLMSELNLGFSECPYQIPEGK